jgi:hypothetical protein
MGLSVHEVEGVLAWLDVDCCYQAVWNWKGKRLLHNPVKHVKGEAVKKTVQRCSSEIEYPFEPVSSARLF